MLYALPKRTFATSTIFLIDGQNPFAHLRSYQDFLERAMQRRIMVLMYDS